MPGKVLQACQFACKQVRVLTIVNSHRVQVMIHVTVLVPQLARSRYLSQYCAFRWHKEPRPVMPALLHPSQKWMPHPPCTLSSGPTPTAAHWGRPTRPETRWGQLGASGRGRDGGHRARAIRREGHKAAADVILPGLQAAVRDDEGQSGWEATWAHSIESCAQECIDTSMGNSPMVCGFDDFQQYTMAFG